MNQEKIGKYIADKRKCLGLTQVQLAEKLGMSNKSVSKWERGVCLPDVSIYEKLCEALGISINEFLAGEDLSTAEVITKSEETIISITKDNKRNIRRANMIGVLLIVVLLALTGAFIGYLNNQIGFLYKYCIVPLTESSPEVQTANMLEENDTWLYRYYVKSSYERMQIRYYWYKEGKLIDEGTLQSYELSGNHYGRGLITIVDDDENGALTAKAMLEGNNCECVLNISDCNEFKLPVEGESLTDWQNTYTRYVVAPQNEIYINPIRKESAFLLMCYDENGSLKFTENTGQNVTWFNVRESCIEVADYDYAVFVTVKFGYESVGKRVKLWP